MFEARDHPAGRACRRLWFCEPHIPPRNPERPCGPELSRAGWKAAEGQPKASAVPAAGYALSDSTVPVTACCTEDLYPEI